MPHKGDTTPIDEVFSPRLRVEQPNMGLQQYVGLEGGPIN